MGAWREARLRLATAARRAAGIAFETRAIANEGEVSALLTRFAFIALHPRFADEVGLAPFDQRLDGKGDGLRDRNGLSSAGLSLENMAGAGHARRRHPIEARQLQLVLVAGPLAHKATRDPGLVLKFGRLAHLLVFTRADASMAVLVRIDVCELVPLQIGDGELPEDVVEDRGRVLYPRIAANEASRLEAREGK